MGETSKRLHRTLKKMAAPGRRPTKNRGGLVEMTSIEEFIKDGLDPVHAVYAFVQHITSHFAEGVSQLPEMAAYAKVVGEAEDEYLPSGPPMSPLTSSYFTTWAFYDLKIGRGTDTLGTCLVDANDLVCMNSDQLNALKKMQSSRMGIYEHCGTQGSKVVLRELISDDEFICHSTSGYQGHERELWYVRLLPPLNPNLADYHIVFTTPYILIHATKGDRVNFLKRSLLQFRSDDDRQALYRLLKHGPERHFWNEFVFKAYHHHQYDAIFLAGIPDLQDSLPMREG